jgi:D-serine deaminase-like pyridoxal phosphate-dependent protein
MTSQLGAVGRMKMALDTPVLLVDLAVMEGNIRQIAAICRNAKVAWRPHTKGIKIPAIAHEALAAGAIGVTCAKLGEAEVMAAAGIHDILVANQIVGAPKIARLIGLQRHAEVKVLVDSADNVAALAAEASAVGVRLRVLIEVDIGMGRAGVVPGEPAIALARTIKALPALELVGVAGWEGHTTEISDEKEKAAAIERAVSMLTATADALRRAGFSIPIVSCGGTGTFRFTTRLPGVTEIQAGGGILSDVRYRTKCNADLPYSLTVLTTVISRPNERRIICDAGKKTMSSDAAVPLPLGVEFVRSVNLSAEHARVELDQPSHSLKVGDKLEFVVGYSDTTVHLHEEMIGIRDGRAEVVWPILGRGKLR